MYAKNDNGTIKTYGQLPKKFNSILNFQNASEQVHQDNGFYPLVDVELTATQNKGNLYFDEPNKVFTYEIIEKSAEEIQQEAQAQQEAQIDALNAKFEMDGAAYFQQKKREITVLLIGKANAIPMMQEIKNSIYPMLNAIKQGDYPLAMLDYMDGQNNPVIPEILALFNEIGAYVTDYYTTKYPHK